MSKVLFLSVYADGYSIACKMAEQGDEVHFYIEEEKFQGVGEGRENPKVLKKPPPFTSDYDLIIPTMVGMGRLADRYRKAGKVVLSGGALGDAVELDQAFGLKVAMLSKVQGPPTGVVNGIEISTEVWFNGREEVPPFIHTLQYKRFMEGDKGQSTECMGAVVWVSEKDKIVKQVLEPLYPFFKKARYTGPLGVHLVASEGILYFLNFTCRVGYDSTQALGELVKDEWFNILHGVATKTLQKMPLYKGKYAISVRLSMPPYPVGGETSRLHGVQTVEIPKEASPHVWLSDVCYTPPGTPVMSGVSGVVGCVTAWGETLREAQRRVYRTVKNIAQHPDLQYRLDIGKDAEERIVQLQKWGWLNAN